MSLRITYFAHGTTTDNEKGIATGWNPGELSHKGREQCLALKTLLAGRRFDVVFCSDLKRAVDSAALVFGERATAIVRDNRLRECNYGQLNGGDASRVDAMMPGRIVAPFPAGESCADVEERVRRFLEEMNERYDGCQVALVSHRCPQLALDVICGGLTWQRAIEGDWRRTRAWKAGWEYQWP